MMYNFELGSEHEAKESKNPMSTDFANIKQTLSTFGSASSFNNDLAARKKTHLLLKGLIKSLPNENIDAALQEKLADVKVFLELSQQYRKREGGLSDYLFNRAKEVVESCQEPPSLRP